MASNTEYDKRFDAKYCYNGTDLGAVDAYTIW